MIKLHELPKPRAGQRRDSGHSRIGGATQAKPEGSLADKGIEQIAVSQTHDARSQVACHA